MKIRGKFISNCITFVFFQDFVNLNIRWLCYCLDKSKENFKKCLMKFYTAVQMKKIENIKFCWRVS